MIKEENHTWTEVITPTSTKRIRWNVLWYYRDLILLFVKRDFVKEFKQTILGPLWFIIQPLFQTFVLLFVFGNLGGMGPQGIPQTSFYLAGTLIWNVFSENLIKTSETFRANAPIFGKVYFPRIVVPISLMLTNFLKLGVQLVIFLLIYFFELSTAEGIEPNWYVLLIPFFFILVAIAGMGLGLIISSLTTKYWDLRFLLQFGIQLLMFLSTVITPFYMLQDKPMWMQWSIMGNPVSSLIEAVRFAFLGSKGGELFIPGLIYSSTFAVLTLIIGLIIFNRVERNFMDTV